MYDYDKKVLHKKFKISCSQTKVMEQKTFYSDGINLSDYKVYSMGNSYD